MTTLTALVYLFLYLLAVFGVVLFLRWIAEKLDL